ncbi:DUF6894 family protein [Sphingomonas sp. S2-65]|uniref:DUF6894 family protein n=1 Tax=Sphingomonas sp. S2-65 TaxID=2903960 RepID=UPI001F471168|nr:hypothetical protein [Sphingomonas sp. S2-65]UYY59798.1 hypothetical protein LZ586_06860 [Sphingomonas sp. S2-65]
MHRFYFHLHQCGASYPDAEGIELPSFEAALEEAFRAARSLMAKQVESSPLRSDCRIEIVDRYGILLATVPCEEAIAARS